MNRAYYKNILSQHLLIYGLDDERESQQSRRAVIETLDGRSDTIMFNKKGAKFLIRMRSFK
jgi:hypothetical protein